MSFFEFSHPMLVHFPIAFLLLYSVLEIVSYFKNKEVISGFINLLLILGVAGLMLSVLTGDMAAQNYYNLELNKQNEIAGFIAQHESWATATVFFFTAGAFFRIYVSAKNKMTKKIKLILIVFSVAGTMLLITTADFGGKLVYRHGVGTDIIINK